jgi:hypothetical protein
MTIINGKQYPDGNICITDDSVIIDGILQDGEKLSGIIRIEVTGDLKNLIVKKGSVTVHGNIQGDIDTGGSVACGNVHGSIDTGGSVSCEAVGGNVDAGGSVNCWNVGGNVDAGGSIIHK